MSTKKLLLHKLFVISLLAGFFLVFVLVTNPNNIALPLLLVPFLLLGIVLYHSVYVVTFIARRQMSINLSKIFALSIASLGVLLLLLQSLNQLTWKDGVITTVFAIMFWVYVWRADFLHK